MAAYQPHAIESKWRARWEETGAHESRLTAAAADPCYCLVMFSYPSGNKLHLGHWFNYAPTDTWARFRKMQGANVFQPMGFDSFGLPAENYAIKENVHPRLHTEANIEYMKEQLRTIGAMYDWSHEVQTHRADYYRWTQWLFLELYRAGFAYREEAPVNWCDSCQTVLANEQVIQGACERCDNPVRRRSLTQWFFRITAFADALLEGLDRIDWPAKTIAMQRNWIGRSEGAAVEFTVTPESLDGDDDGRVLPVFTTRPDTLFGVTYMVLAPEHPLVERITRADQRESVRAYVEAAARVSEIERTSTVGEKTGVFTGAFAVNPVNGEEIPIWIADYVLASYGTGAVMAVPAHDERDFEFALRFQLPVRRVIEESGGADEPVEQAFVDDGPMCNSGEFDGLSGAAARAKVIERLETSGHGEGTVNFRLRDWLVSRQRYWGAPIPIVHCPECGEVPVPDDELPVVLPEDVEFVPTGESPLRRHPTWQNVDCPACGAPARRETDTMDTFVDSSWYFLRYLDPSLEDAPFPKDLLPGWTPVHQYVGGGEHAVMHLLYARFVMKVLHRLGHVPVDEPFARLVHQGVITSGGARMSKSRGNVVNPEDYLERFGSDALRAYLMFGFAYIEGGDWDDSGLQALHRYLNRVVRFLEENEGRLGAAEPGGLAGAPLEELRFTQHNSVKGATLDLERFQFNTAISRHMELTNALYAYANAAEGKIWSTEVADVVRDWVKLLAPLTPHLGEELWERLGHSTSVFESRWPTWDEAALEREQVTVVIQVNGKLREQMQVARGLSREEIGERAKTHGRIPHWIGEKQIRKVIVVPDKLVNIVVA